MASRDICHGPTWSISVMPASRRAVMMWSGPERGRAMQWWGDVRSMTILVGNEPRAYREVVARFLTTAVPGVDIHVADPARLDEDITRIAPDLVVCSHLTDAVTALRNWLMWPGTGSGGVLRRNGTDRTVGSFNLAILLETVQAVHQGGDR